MELLKILKTQIEEKNKENLKYPVDSANANWTSQFINFCPFCRVQSFFSPVSLELHKSICQKTMQNELLAYSRISLVLSSINAMREKAATSVNSQLELQPIEETDEIKNEYLPKETSENAESPQSEEQSSSDLEINQSASKIKRQHHESAPSTPEASGLPLSLSVSILPQPVEVSVERVSPRSIADPYPKKRTTCQVCNKKFRSLAQLEQHTRAVHEKSADTRPHKCPLCPAKFKVSGTLVTHLRTHTGEKPFPCSDCGKRFSQKSALTRHKMIHTGEKPFECIFCLQRFRYKDALASHEIKMHRSPSLVLPPPHHHF